MLGFGVLVRIAQVFGAFWRLFGPFLGHIVELEGTRELFDTVKSSRTCSVITVSFGRFARVLGLFWAKNGCFWPKTAQIWEGTSQLGTPTPGRHR